MLLDDITTELVASGIASTSIYHSSKASIPSGAGPYITLTETGGTGPTYVQNQAGPATQRPTVQVAVRAATWPAARAKAKDAYTALAGIWNTTINSTVYLHITARQEPTDLGLDEAGRVVVVFNLDVEKQPS